MKQIYLIRHGQSTANAGGISIPNAQVPLTELGYQQSKQVAQWLHSTIDQEIQTLFVSKFLRTQQTAQAMAQQLGITPVILDNLQEFNFLPFSSIAGLDQTYRRKLTKIYWREQQPNDQLSSETESFIDFANRVQGVLQQFQTFNDGTYIAYTHGTWLAMLTWLIFGHQTESKSAMQNFRHFELGMSIKNCTILRLTLSNNTPPSIQKVFEV